MRVLNPLVYFNNYRKAGSAFLRLLRFILLGQIARSIFLNSDSNKAKVDRGRVVK